MRRIQLITLLFLTSLVFSLGACKTSSDVVSSNWIQKRKYTKGFYVAKKAKSENDQAQVVTEPNQTEAALPSNETDSKSSIQTDVQAEHFADQKQKTFLPVNQNEDQQEKTQTSSTEGSSTKNAEPKANVLQEEAPFAQMKNIIDLNSETNPSDDTELILLVILAIVLPPLAVFLMYGLEVEFWISLLLTLLVWLPGVIYALYHVFKNY